MGFLQTFEREYMLWTECLQLLKIPPNIYIHSALWGNRAGATNFQSPVTYDRPNQLRVSSQMLNNNDSDMRKYISSNLNSVELTEMQKYCVFFVISEGKVKELAKEIVLHSYVLVATRDGKKIKCKILD